MRSRLEARAAAFLDSVPGVRWEYEPAAYADASGQYLPDFEVVGALNVPLFVEVRGVLPADAVPRLERAMKIVWSSVPDAALAVWTPAVIEEGAPFRVVRDWWPPEYRVLRPCSVCGHGLLAPGADWALPWSGLLCSECEEMAAA